MKPRLLRHLAFGLGTLSLLAIIVAQLALTDIYHGEKDLSLEWRAVQAAFGVTIALHLTALVALIRLRTP
jgi:hypothetical protein